MADELTICVDWDDTLVDALSQEWLPGALDALRWMRRQKHTIIVHSARARTDFGCDQIRVKLAEFGFSRVKVRSKPYADLYIDDKAAPFQGSWPELVRYQGPLVPRHAGASRFHDGSPVHRTRKQRKRRGREKQSRKDKRSQSR